MGYYVHIQESTFELLAKDYDVAYEAMCALNQYDDIKRGGSFRKDPETGEEITNRWFSWMTPDYPESLNTAIEILHEVGFDLDEHDTSLTITNYDNKTGQEDLFLEAICPWASGHIVWSGEDGDRWMDNYDHMVVRRFHPADEWIQDNSYTGALAESVKHAKWMEEYTANMIIQRKEREAENV